MMAACNPWLQMPLGDAVVLQCRVLDKAINAEDKPAAKDLHMLQADYLKALGFNHWHRAELANIRNFYPSSLNFPLF